MFLQQPLPLPLPNNQTLENFVKGSPNHEVFQWINLWPNLPMQGVIIHGESNCGKTHIARGFQQKTNGLYLSPEDFMSLSSPITIFEKKPTVLIIDDYDLISVEKTLFHIYNLAKERQTPLLFFGKQSASIKSFSLADLRSRLRSLHTIPILSPDETFFKDLLKARIDCLGLHYTQDVCEYLFRRLERTYEAIHKIILSIDYLTLVQQRPLTVPLLREILETERNN